MTSSLRGKAFDLQALVSPFLPQEERRHVALVEKAFEQSALARENAKAEPYARLRKAISESATIFLRDQNAWQPVQIGKTLGEGANKQAFLLGEGRVLLLPRFYDKEEANMATWWECVVHNEITLTKLFAKLGLLTPQSRQVSLALSSAETTKTIPAYLSTSFAELAKQGCWVLENNGDNSTWIQGKDYLFRSHEERLDESRWAVVLEPFLEDLAKICLYDLPAFGDSLHLAIVKNTENSNSEPTYFVRYFGFDFSSCDQVEIFKGNTPLPARLLEAKAYARLYNVLDLLFSYEFGDRYSVKYAERGSRNGEEAVDKLFDTLLEKLPKIVTSKMEKLRSIPSS